MFVTDGANSRVEVFDQEGQFLYEFPVSFPPQSLTYAHGKLYTARGSSDGGVEIYDAAGNYMSECTDELLPGRSRFPYDIAVDSDGNIYTTQPGSYYGTQMDPPNFLKKFDPDCNRLWYVKGTHVWARSDYSCRGLIDTSSQVACII